MLIKSLTRIVLYTVDLPVTEYDAYVKTITKAHLLGVENIKLSHAAIADAADEEICRVIAVAEAFSIKILFELDAEHMEIFGFERYAKLRCEGTGLIFNPNEFIKLHQNPFNGVIYKSKYKDDMVFLRVCDMVFDTLEPKLPEHGNAQIKECASNLISRSFKGYFSFTPYGEGIEITEVIDAFINALCLM